MTLVHQNAALTFHTQVYENDNNHLKECNGSESCLSYMHITLSQVSSLNNNKN